MNVLIRGRVANRGFDTGAKSRRWKRPKELRRSAGQRWCVRWKQHIGRKKQRSRV